MQAGIGGQAVAAQAKIDLLTIAPVSYTHLHLRVYLNDELMGVVPVEKDQLGQRVRRQLAMDPKLLSDFNRVRLEFVGHYTCLLYTSRQHRWSAETRRDLKNAPAGSPAGAFAFNPGDGRFWRVFNKILQFITFQVDFNFSWCCRIDGFWLVASLLPFF